MKLIARKHAIFIPFQYVGGEIALRQLKDFLAPNCFYSIDDDGQVFVCFYNNSDDKFALFVDGWILKDLDGTIRSNCYTTEELNKLYVEITLGEENGRK
jgi:hypothetical protein